MEKQKKEQNEAEGMLKTDADFIIPVLDYDPNGQKFYHKLLLKRVTKGAISGGIFIGIIFWMIASGVLPFTGLGQISAADYGAAAFLGFVTGSATGGLIGSISGILKMQK